MPLQNRVDPFGTIWAVPERGLFTGNRGILHDPDTKTLLKRRWTLKAWIICVCEFRGVRRVPMGRNRQGSDQSPARAGWTELFFLDEVTALAAGHRPCFFCQRERAKNFLARFGAAFAVCHPRAPMMDARLHGERMASGGRLEAFSACALNSLPDGAMFADDGNSYAICAGAARRWSFKGYERRINFGEFADHPLHILTPATTLGVLQQGYAPKWHPTAQT